MATAPWTRTNWPKPRLGRKSIAARSTGAGAIAATGALASREWTSLPGTSLPDDAAEALAGFVTALPQGRGRLVLDLGSEAGIGAAELGLLALAKDPSGAEALARFLAGARISAQWVPGLSP